MPCSLLPKEQISKYVNLTTYLYLDTTNPIEFACNTELPKCCFNAITVTVLSSALFGLLQPATQLFTGNTDIQYDFTSYKHHSLTAAETLSFIFLICMVFPLLINSAAQETETKDSRAIGYRAFAYLTTLIGMGTFMFYPSKPSINNLYTTGITKTLPLVIAATCMNVINKSICLILSKQENHKYRPLLSR